MCPRGRAPENDPGSPETRSPGQSVNMEDIRLIVNADDLGLDIVVNEGILAAHATGIVTSASLMVRRPAAADAAGRAIRAPGLSVGLHYDLGEWVRSGDAWTLRNASADPDDRSSVEADVAGQVAMFERLMGRAPTHLDSHQHVHRTGAVKSVILEVGGRLGVPVRHFTPGVRYEGGFYGRTSRDEPAPEYIGVEALVRILDRLEPGVTELCCHPSAGQVHGTAYGEERRIEFETLRDPAVAARIASRGIRLIGFTELPMAMVSA